jgi:hypothetical protein
VRVTGGIWIGGTMTPWCRTVPRILGLLESMETAQLNQLGPPALRARLAAHPGCAQR